LVARLVEVQVGLVEAVDRLERRTAAAPADTAPLPAPALRPRRSRSALRLAGQTVGALVAGVAVAVVFSAGPGLHPGVGMPPALADPTSTTTGQVSPQTTAGRAGSQADGPTTSTVGARQGRTPTRPAMTVPAGPAASSTTLPVVSSTTVPLPETSVPLPEVPTTTTLCRNPHGCDG
jgi:hypothetical protein